MNGIYFPCHKPDMFARSEAMPAGDKFNLKSGLSGFALAASVP